MVVAYIFLLFEHILKLKLVDPKKNHSRVIDYSVRIFCCRIGRLSSGETRWIIQLVDTNIAIKSVFDLVVASSRGGGLVVSLSLSLLHFTLTRGRNQAALRHY